MSIPLDSPVLSVLGVVSGPAPERQVADRLAARLADRLEAKLATRWRVPVLRMAGPTVDPAASRETADVLLSAPQLGPGHSAADGRHPAGPSSIELWHRRTCGDPLGVLDLLEMIDLVVAAVLPRHRWTAHPVAHPGTLRGRRIDVVPVGAESAVRPVGIGGGGLVRPEILDGAALPPGTTGLALTLRLDRLANLTGPRNDSSGTPTD